MGARTASRTNVDRLAGMPGRLLGQLPIGVLAVACLLPLGLMLGCAAGEPAAARSSPRRESAALRQLAPAPNVAGDPAAGRRLFVSSGCAGCHTSYDVPGATGVAGPNLTNVVLRPTLAGDTIPMTPDTLAAFLQEPAQVKPGTTMPAIGLTAEEAQQIAAFLYSQPYNDPPP